MQVVWRDAPLIVEEVVLDAADGDVAEQLRERFDPRKFRLDVRQAPMLRGFLAHDAAEERWLLLILSHHLALDHTTLEVVVEEARAHLLGDVGDLLAPIAVPRLRGAGAARRRAGRSTRPSFEAMLGDVSEPTAPFGLVDVRGDGSGVEEARLAARSGAGASAARTGARARSERGEPLPSGLRAGAGAGLGPRRRGVRHGAVRAHAWRRREPIERSGIFINTLPLRVRSGRGGRRGGRAAHA